MDVLFYDYCLFQDFFYMPHDPITLGNTCLISKRPKTVLKKKELDEIIIISTLHVLGLVDANVKPQKTNVP